MAGELISTTEFAKIKGVSPRAVRKAITDGRIHAERIDGNLFVDPDEALLEWEGNTLKAASVSHDFDSAVKQMEEIHPETGNRTFTLAETRMLKEFFSGYELRLKCQKMAGELIPVVQAQQEIDLALTRFKSSLQTLPQAFMSSSAHLVGTEIAIQQSEILEALIKKTLTNICDVEIEGAADESI